MTLPCPSAIPIATLFEQAVAHHQAGQRGAAEQLYREILARSPQHPDSLKLLGLLALQSGHPEPALALIDMALTIKPGNVEYLTNRGQAQKALGRFDDAVLTFREALRRRPGTPELLYNLGNTLREAGKLEEARDAFRRAIKRRPDLLDAHNNLGNTLRQLGNFDEAADCFRHAILLRPDVGPLHFNLDAALDLAGRPQEAVDSFRAWIRLGAETPVAHLKLGQMLARTGQHSAALSAFEASLRLQPGNAEAHTEAAYALAACDRLTEAERHPRAAAQAAPDDPSVHNNLGNILRDLDQDEEAVATFETALRLKPGSAPARYGLAITHLLAGRYDEGWVAYEARFEALLGVKSRFESPTWRGEDTTGRGLLIHAEQGQGDTIQFCHYVPLVARRARVILEVHPTLVTLMSGLEDVTEIIATGSPLPAFDLDCPMMSLPLALRTTVDSIPAEIPYLRAAPDQIEAWRKRLAAIPGIRVGIAWAGSGAYSHDALRSVPASALAALDGIDGTVFVSLQKGGGRDGNAQAPALIDYDWTYELNSFAETAALIEALDLVISVDTAVAHLAGALGRPVWLLNRRETDWRWAARADRQPVVPDPAPVPANPARRLERGIECCPSRPRQRRCRPLAARPDPRDLS